MIPPFQSTVLIFRSGVTGGNSVACLPIQLLLRGNIALACSGLPSEATCVFVPPSFTPSGTAGTTTVGITVTTKAATAMSSSRRRTFPALWMACLGLLVSGVLVTGKRQCTRGLYLLFMLILLVVRARLRRRKQCKPQSAAQMPEHRPAFPTVVVTATSGSIVSTSSFTLIVQ